MARVLVMASEDHGLVLMDEIVLPADLADEQTAQRVVERLAWAVSDCEVAEIANANNQQQMNS